MTRLEDLKHEVNVAVLAAIDEILVPRFGKAAMVTDADLPSILPSIERLVERRLRTVYVFLPESLEQPTPSPEEVAADNALRGKVS